MKKIRITTLAIIFLSVPLTTQAVDRLIIKDASENTTFVVQDNGVARLDAFNGTGKFSVAENASVSNPASPQTMFELSRSGAIRLDLVDDSNATTWVFQNRNGNFDITKAGTGSQEFQLDGSGNLAIRGSLSENSDVNSKENITQIEGKEMLARMATLPVSKWNYKNDATKSTHVGPMAQDFHASFGLGPDNRHISPRDLAGVAVVGVKELHKQNQEQTKMIRQREAEIAELKQRLAALEQLVNRLSANSDRLANLSTPSVEY